MASLPSYKTIGGLDGSPESHKLVHDRKRDLDHRNKYSLGAVTKGPASKPNARAIQPVKRPEKINPRRFYFHKSHPRYAVRDKQVLTAAAENSLDEASSESDTDTTPRSFDAPTGPSDGSGILNVAVAKAVERFETKETERLVKKEYDVLDRKEFEEDDEEVKGYFGDDDFELI